MEHQKIHFVALVSIDFDIDMLPYFIPHYSEMELDNYCLFLHEGKDKAANQWAEQAAKEAGWKCRFISHKTSFGNGELKKILLNKFQKACDLNDYILCSDADEIQHWNCNPHEMISQKADIVLGRRVDRLNEKLIDIDHSIDLEANFPITHDNVSKILYPKRPRTRDKIIMAKAKVPVDYRKCTSLSILGNAAGFKILGDVSIFHYKWRSNLLERLNERTDYTQDEIIAIKKFFNVEVT